MSNMGGLGVGGLGPQYRGANYQGVTFDPVALLQSAWEIDAVNGVDYQTGLPGAPLKTFAELKRRWGPSPVLRQPVTVTCLTDLPPTDAMNLNVFLAGSGTGAFPFVMQGTKRTIASGVITGVVPQDPTAPAGGQRYEITDGAVVWGPFIDRRLRITSGPRAGATAWIQQDLGAGACQTTNWVIRGDFFLSPVVPVVGDPYVVEAESEIFFETLTIEGEFLDGFVFASAFIRDFHWRVLNGFGFAVVRGKNVSLQFETNRIEPVLLDEYSSYYQNCNVINVLSSAGGLNVVAEAGAIGSPSGFSAGFAANPFNGALYLDEDILVRGASIGEGGILDVRRAAFWDSAPAGTSNPLGSGIYIRPAGALVQQDHAPQRIWGAGNAGVGIDLQSGAKGALGNAGTVPNVTGVAGDFRLGGALMSRAWDEGASVYTALLANTWANFAAAVPAGFGGNAHNVERSTDLVSEV